MGVWFSRFILIYDAVMRLKSIFTFGVRISGFSIYIYVCTATLLFKNIS